jgi:LacI family transcriptional regulator
MSTIKDVAREAGVAVGTVSKFLNNKSMSVEYRQRVEDAVKTLEYQVNTYARGFKTKRTEMAALILPDIRHPFFSSIAYYTEKFLYERNYKMLLCSSGGVQKEELQYINMAKQSKVDGIIAITYQDIDSAITSDIPFVSIDRHFGSSVPCVTSDNFGGGHLAARKLLELGCKRPAYIGFGSVFLGEVDRRRDGFIKGCTQGGIKPEVFHFFEEEDDLSTEDKYRKLFAAHIHEGVLNFDGLFIVTDDLAYLGIQILKEFHLEVPRDVQVIGFDGIRKFNKFDYVVSTICQPVAQIAELCVSLLLAKDRGSLPALTALPVEYVRGGTTRDEGL